jgi:hypothetical protein
MGSHHRSTQHFGREGGGFDLAKNVATAPGSGNPGPTRLLALPKRRLLRTRGERPRCRRTPEKGDELAPFHVCSPQPRITLYHTVPGKAALCIIANLAGNISVGSKPESISAGSMSGFADGRHASRNYRSVYWGSRLRILFANAPRPSM